MRHHRYPLGPCLALAMAALPACSESPTEISSAAGRQAFAATATTAVTGTFLGSFGAHHSAASAITQSGIIGGFAHDDELPRIPVIFDGNQQLSALPNAALYGAEITGLSDLSGGGTAATGHRYAWTRPAGGDWSAATPLPDLGAGSNSFSVNASGAIAGFLIPPVIGSGGGFSTPGGAVAALWTPVGDGTWSLAQVQGLPGCTAHSLRSINDAGVAIGYSVCKSGKNYVARPFVSMSGGPAQQLPMGSHTSVEVWSLSEAGHVAGFELVNKNTLAVLLWTPMTDGSYGPPERVLDIDSNSGVVRGVNSCGTIVGIRTANGEIQGFAVRDGWVTDLDPLPGSSQAWVDEINDAGTAVGYSWITTGKGRTATSYRQATMWQVPGC